MVSATENRHENDKIVTANKWKGLVSTELGEECQWETYASPWGVTSISN